MRATSRGSTIPRPRRGRQRSQWDPIPPSMAPTGGWRATCWTVPTSLYGIEIAVDFTARLRGQVKFDGVEALISQMRLDVELARELL